MERAGRHFQDELELLTSRLLEMGGLAEERVRRSVHGLVEWDLDEIQSVLIGDEPVNQLHIEIDTRCFRLLALHQPMAADLRAILAAVKINTDLERVADLAVNIAEAAQRYRMHVPVKKLIDIPRMAEIAQSMLRDALDAFVRRDIGMAQGVLNADDQLDTLKTQVFRALLTYMLQDPSTIEPALDLILVSRHLERIGDHATNVAEDVIFMVSARDVRHHATDPRAGARPAPPLQAAGSGRQAASGLQALSPTAPAGCSLSPAARQAAFPRSALVAPARAPLEYRGVFGCSALCAVPAEAGRSGVQAVLQRAVPPARPRPVDRR